MTGVILLTENTSLSDRYTDIDRPTAYSASEHCIRRLRAMSLAVKSRRQTATLPHSVLGSADRPAVT